MLAIAAASLVSIAAAARTPCPDGRTIPPDQPCPAYDRFSLPFDWSSAEVTPAMEGSLFNAIAAHRTDPSRQIILAGHTDRSGSAPANLRLSQRRAQAVRRYLISRGIPPEKITIEAHGETRPLVGTADGVRERRNSRVEISFRSGW